MTALSQNGLRTISQASLSAGLALGFAALAPNGAAAQQTQPVAGLKPDGTTVELETITVEGQEEGEGEGNTPPNTLKATTGVGRLPGSVQDTPQTITVIPRETLEQQKVTTLDQALTNVPGVTTAIGEGGGGMNGDQFRIRGFQAKGDIYTDGLRDFGVYVRDAFAYESVEVLKGPSSESFGMGTTGGVINSRVKRAHEGDSYSADVTGGSGPLGRAIMDINKQINETTAARIVGMGHVQDIEDRDHVESNRHGVLAALAFGLGTDTNWNLNYFHQHNDRTPDYGVPSLPASGGAASTSNPGQPITEYAVPRNTFYGKDTDEDISDIHMLTSLFQKEAAPWLTLHNDTRFSYFERAFKTTVPACSGACLSSFQAGGNPTISFGGGNPSYDQESFGVQNISYGIAEFETGWLRHELVAGIDVFYQDDHRQALRIASGIKNPSQILTPNFETTDLVFENNPDNVKDGDSLNIGLFVSDRVWLTDEFSVLGGVRYDNYSANYDFRGSVNSVVGDYHLESDSEFLSPKASLIWEPTEHQTYYISWAESAQPAGQFITNDNNAIGTTPGQDTLEPEEAETYELGGKISLLDGKLGLTAALFRVDKSNATYTDPDGNTIPSGEEHRVQGIELGVSGEVTDAWTLAAAYAYNDGEVLYASILRSGTGGSTGVDAIYDPNSAVIGNEVPFVSAHSFSLWTSYDLTEDLLPQIKGTWLVGGGTTYRSEYFTNSSNANIIPETFTFDLFTSYEIDKYRFALNGFNLTDELNYSAAFNNRAIPSSGRTFTVSVGATF